MYEVENQNADHKRHIDEHNRGQCFAVSVPYDFYVSETYVTNGQYRAFVQAQGYETIVERYQTGYSVDARGRWEQGGSHSWRCLPWEPSDDLPVVQVSWADAMEYAAWLGGQLGAPVRLPTADEWGHH